MESKLVKRWEVYLDDAVIKSEHTQWDDVPNRIIALKIWFPTKKMLLWGLSHYGRPDTLKEGIDIEDSNFARILEEAKRSK
jgi:hypothetical protein